MRQEKKRRIDNAELDACDCRCTSNASDNCSPNSSGYSSSGPQGSEIESMPMLEEHAGHLHQCHIHGTLQMRDRLLVTDKETVL